MKRSSAFSQTLISVRSSEELFRLLPRELRTVVNFYFLRVGIYDESPPEPRVTLYASRAFSSRLLSRARFIRRVQRRRQARSGQ
jgi:hypothetical protein